jgi:phosphoglycolate phosphatase
MRAGHPNAAGRAKPPPPPGWKPRVLVCDVDGTLTFKDRKLDPHALEALRAAESAGVTVVLATGNVLPIAYALSYLIGTSGPVVAENGGLLYYKGKVEQLSSRVEVEEVARAVETSLGLRRLFTDRWRVTEVAFPEGGTTHEDVLREVRAHPKGAAVRVERTGFAVHLMDLDCEKLRGVKRALDLIGASLEDAMAIGDSDNDVEMVAAARVGVALADGSAPLKAAADLVTAREAGLGIKEALERYGVARFRTKARGAGGRPTAGRQRRKGAGRRARPPRPARAATRGRPASRRAGPRRKRS